VPWRQIADLGNRIRHGYLSIDPARVWTIVELRLDAVGDAIRRYVASLDDTS
jgi:uncharacterized protein with HEPN domain